MTSGSGSFYGRGPSFTSGAGLNREDGNWDGRYASPAYGTPPSHLTQPPSHEVAGLNQKLDRLFAVITEQRSALEKGTQEAADLKRQVQTLEESLTEIRTSMKRLPGSSTLKKSRIPKDLSKFVKDLHANFNKEEQFKGSESYTSPHNTQVKETIMSDMKMKFLGTYSPARIKRSIHRYYESRRRLFNDKQPNRVEKAKTTKWRSAKTANQRKLYNRRKDYLKGENEKKKWSELGPAYMTEESEAEGDVFRQHHLKWRSEEVNKLVRKIDRRIAKTAPRSTIQPKKRERSTQSDSGPPTMFPDWAVDPTYQRSSSSTTTPHRESSISGRTLEFSDLESPSTSNQDSDSSSD